ncbi:Dihydrofolate reductase [Rhynchospora pubera]|uniref:Dihydrofolate reductase n=1 Tax=Rhynchospora pubera TaxID=906938 RepID=A0AAV8DA01_9POAL|nr:Dihydrofolate reductase [Rhynchospora pubera]KAJ4793720.1 Dihydrofolate reductase [Rhynchospora pubera]KAJ4817563.1 Dihydrofolate reductase [Rhynchospora pubera]
MGSIEPEAVPLGGEITAPTSRKPRFLCLHGRGTSGAIMEKQVVGKWPHHVTSRMDLFFADGPLPSKEGSSPVEGIFPPPYYEWIQYSEDFKDCQNFDESVAYIEDLMIKHGPFDGLMGFSQGAILSAALPGLQARGLALTKVPKIKWVVIISGAVLPKPKVAQKAFGTKIECRSLHFLGEEDFLKIHGEKLLKSFVDPLVIYHPKGHTVPKLVDENSLETMDAFLSMIESDIAKTVNDSAEEKSPIVGCAVSV